MTGGVTAIVRSKNEADIVEPFLRHTLQHVDRIVIQDNSEDSTTDIIKALIAEQLPIKLIDESILVGDYQAKNATDLMHAEAHASTWIVPLDCDEFIKAARPLREILGASPPILYKHYWQSYVWENSSFWSAPVHFTKRLETEAQLYCKVIVPAEIAKTASLVKGAHHCPGLVATPLIGSALAHFPVRSAQQWGLKATIHDIQERAISATTYAVNGHPAIKDLRSLGAVTESTLTTFSRQYSQRIPEGWKPLLVEDPLNYCGGPLYHTVPVQLLPTLLKFVHKMASELGRIRR